MMKGINLDEFLAARDISLADVREAVGVRVGIEAGELAFVSGSLLEGFGTEWSDLDAYLLTEREITSGQSTPMLTFNCGRAIIDLESWSPARIDLLIERLEGLPHDEVRDPRHVLGISVSEVEMLHRLYNGVPLGDEERHASLRARIHPLALSRLIFDRAAARISSAQIDLLGLLGAGDFHSSLVLSQTLLGFVADALLASLGNTNPSDKWRLRKLQQLTDTDWDQDLPGGRLEPSAEEFFFALMCPLSREPEALEELAFQCVRLANRIIPWGQRRFLSSTVRVPVSRNVGADKHPTGSAGTTLPKHGEPTVAESGDERRFTPPAMCPRLKLESQIRWNGDSLSVASVGSGSVLEIERITHEALLLFDGKTSQEQMVERLACCSRASREDLRKAINDLQVVLEFHHLIDVAGGGAGRQGPTLGRHMTSARGLELV
jgi:hypothetical protein